ncbi:MAG TPA: hypothetical protein VEK78_09075 [Gemmatimonadales bacterium]|nr:hypothetical protein [Gemmatimonadales bacterium]
MTRAPAILVAVATLAALPRGAAAQRVSSHDRFPSGPYAARDQNTTPPSPNTLLWVRPAGLEQLSAPLPMSRPPHLRAAGTLPVRVTWRATDIALAGGFTAALLIDAGQTRGLARGGWRNWRETNPLLGPRPSVGRINTYTAVAGLAVLGVAAVVPARVRPWLLGAALAVETFTVAGTARRGVAIRLP